MKHRVVCLLLFVGLVFSSIQPARAADPIADQDSTPFQQTLRVAIQERVRTGLPVPADISYTYRIEDSAGTLRSAAAPRQMTVTGITVISFAGPAQAGYTRWPAPIIADTLPPGATGVVAPGDYSAQVRETLARELPGIWDQYAFGAEPRRYTVEETITITYPDAESTAALRALALDPSSYATSREILLGFMYPGPKIDYTIGGKWEACTIFGCATLAEARAGFALDWALGLRLPFEVGVTAPALMEPGDTATLTTAISPRDWSAADYARAGVASEDGNEYVLRFSFFLGAKLKLLGISVVDWALDTNVNTSQSFTPPFGAGASFPIPSLDLDPNETGLNYSLGSFLSLGIGLTIDPLLGSNRITAAWGAVPGTDAAGSGTLTYTTPDSPVDLGPVTFGDFGPAGEARIRLSEFRYWFNQFLVRVRGSLYLNVFGYGTRSGDVTIGTVDLSALTGGLSVGVLAGTSGVVERPIWVAMPPTTNTFMVNTTDDILDASLCSNPTAMCSLRTAIWWTNQLDGRQSVVLPAGQYNLTRVGPGEEQAATGDLDITGDLTIIGDGSSSTVIDGRRSDRVLDIAPGIALELRGVALTNGLVVDPSPSAGGGLRNRGSVTIVGCRIDDNEAEYGGGIHNSGNVELLFFSEVQRNTARAGGGIYNDGQLLISNSSIGGDSAGNQARDGGGGVLNWGGTATIINDSLVSGNNAPNGGGLENGNGGVLEIVNSTVARNHGALYGGGLVNFPTGRVTITTGAKLLDNALRSNDPGSLDHGGGAIHNFAGGIVEIQESVISGNSALANPGAAPVGGGGIRNLGEITIFDCMLIGNQADYGGGIHNAAGARLEIHRSVLADSHAIGGGGIYNEGDAWLSNMTIGGIGAGNSSTGVAVPGNEAVGGGGMVNWGGTATVINDSQIVDNQAENGGGLQNGNGGILTIANSSVARNHATRRGGGVVNFVSGQVTISAGSTFYANGVESSDPASMDIGGGAVLNMAGARVEILDSTLRGNSAGSITLANPVGGGGVRNLGELSVINSTLEQNQADIGGAIHTTGGRVEISTTYLRGNGAILGQGGAINASGSVLAITASEVIGNSAIASSAIGVSCGGGIALQGGELTVRDSNITENETNASPGNWGYGGGICNVGAELTVSGSTLNGNISYGKYGGIGGGLYNRDGTVTLLNSTISGNSAAYAGGQGGALFNQGGSIELTFVTVADNTASVAGALSNDSGPVELFGTIIAGPAGMLCQGAFVDGGANIQYPGSTCGSSIPEADPRIGPLNENGGPTRTHALLPDSPAIDALPPGGCPGGVTVDQRGVARPQGPACDIGAYELIVQSATAAEGETATLLLPPEDGAAGVELQLVNLPFGGPLQALASIYRSNPAPLALLDATSAYVDIRVSGADGTDTMSGTFYYPAGLSESTERNLVLWYLGDTGWAPVRSSGATVPILDPTDMPGDYDAGGRFLVRFGATSIPALTELDGTIFAISVRGAPLCTNVLDDFNRSDGPLGTLWMGKAKKDYRITYQSVDVGAGGPIYWAPETFGRDQAACVTMTSHDVNGECETLLLKVQGADWGKGAIAVAYRPRDQQLAVEVFVPSGTWTWRRLVTVDQTLRDGDRLAAAAFADGTVQVYVNEQLVTEANAGTFFARRGGRIGVWYIDASNARFDDFAGGTAVR